MDAQFNSSNIIPDKGEYKNDPRAHITGRYLLSARNCTTTVCDAINRSGSQALFTSSPRLGTFKETCILPASLKSLLMTAANCSFVFAYGSVKFEASFTKKEK